MTVVAEVMEWAMAQLEAPEGMAGAALARVISNPPLRRTLATAGFTRTTTQFSLHAGVNHLAERFAESLAPR